MKITKGQHYIIKVLNENWKVEITGISKGEIETWIEAKSDNGTPFVRTASDFRAMVENAATGSFVEVDEVEI